MSVQISPNLPANVVEIGNEITQAKVDEINSGTLATQSYVNSQGFAYQAVIDLQNYATQGWVGSQGYATETFVGSQGYLVNADLASYLQDAPSDGNEYIRKNGTWSVATGGGGTFDGGTVNNPITVQDPYTSTNSVEIGNSWITVNSDSHSSIGIGSGEINGVETFRFSDNTSITTAPTGTTNFGDIFAMSIVKDVTWTGSYWTITCEPVNTYLANNGGMAVTNQDNSHFEWMSGVSTTSTWSYNTSTLYYNESIYIQCLGQKSQYPINIQIV